MTPAVPHMKKRDRILSIRRLKMDYPLYLMLAIPVILLFIFNYIPMAGIVIAFQKYLPAKGIFFRHIDGLTLENVTVRTFRPDAREDFVFADVNNLKRG